MKANQNLSQDKMPVGDDRRLPTPAEMIAHLDRFVRGQARAKRDVAVAIYNHYMSQQHLASEGTDLGKHHILLLGPTGTGKTYLVRVLAEFLGVPVGFTSATSLVETGYVGDPVDSVVRALLDRANKDPRKAERGIVFIDEIDKIRRQGTGSQRDISGEGVQNGLLTLLDGRISQGRDTSSFEPVDTSRLLFVCTGAFVGLEEIVGMRLKDKHGRIGFKAMEPELKSTIPNAPVYEALCQAETKDLVAFGMIPEFIGRFTTITTLHDLSRDDLKLILTTTEGSSIDKQRTMARLHGIELEFTPESLDAIAREAEAMGTGARGLHRLVNRAVDPVDFRWAALADEGVTLVRITADCFLNGADPDIVKGERRHTRVDEDLRKSAVAGIPRPIKSVAPETPGGLPPGITDSRGMSSEDTWNMVEKIKHDHLDWTNTSGSARKWWETFQTENKHRPALVLRVVEELKIRGATVTEFFLNYVYSNTDNIQANLHYLDYSRLKKVEEKNKRESVADHKQASQSAPKKAIENEDEADDEAAMNELEKLLDELKPSGEDDQCKTPELVFTRCPACKSLIPDTSIRCRMCGHEIPPKD